MFNINFLLSPKYIHESCVLLYNEESLLFDHPVYAIEASDMAEQASLVFKANGVSDRVTVLKGRVEVISNQ